MGCDMNEPTYYQVLQVDPKASTEVIEAAYRRLAKLYHPDVNKSPDAKRKMQQLNIAYQVLRDPVARWQYDGTLNWRNAKSAASYDRPKPNVPPRYDPPRRPASTLQKMAWLKYQHRVKDGYLISISSATDFYATIEALKAHIPARSRSYNQAKKEWFIGEEYEDVLEALFYNFKPAPYQAYVEPVQTSTYASRTADTRTPAPRTWNGSRRKQSGNAGGIVVIGAIIAVAIWWATSLNGPSAPTRIATSTPNRMVGRVVEPLKTPVSTAAATAISTRQPTATSRPTQTPRPAENTSDAPHAAAPTPQVQVQNCVGGCIMYPDWCHPAIKGNVSYETGEKIYHVLGQQYYDATVINTRYGERWFCTEDEAQAAGWRRSRR